MVKFKEQMADPLMFVEQRNSYMQLKQCHKNWERKIEIAELEAKKARAILKRHGVWAESSGNMEASQN